MGVHLLDAGKGPHGVARLRIQKDPRALFLKEASYSEMDVAVCADCGFVHRFANDLDELVRADKVRNANLSLEV